MTHQAVFLYEDASRLEQIWNKIQEHFRENQVSI